MQSTKELKATLRDDERQTLERHNQFRLRHPARYAVLSGFGIGLWAFVLSDDWRGGMLAAVVSAGLVYGAWFKHGPARRRYLTRMKGNR